MKKTVAAVTLLPVIVIGGAIFAAGRLSLPKDVDITKNGVSEYVIVRADGCDFAVTAACSNLSRGIKKQTGAEIKVVTDKTDRYDAGARIPCEIIVGDTNRQVDCDIAQSLRCDDFSVCVHEKDLVIYAGSNSGYEKAAKYVTDTLIRDGELSVSENFRYVENGEYAIDVLTLYEKDISEYTVVYTDAFAQKYADEFVKTVQEKTGHILDLAQEEKESSVVFGSHDGVGKDEYKIMSENGNIYVSAPTDMGLEAAYNEFSAILFGKEEKTVKIENVDSDGKIRASSEYSDFISARNGLSNTYKKLTKDKKLTVAYFGGSVTVGYSASDRGKYSWRARTTAWIAENFPEAQVTEINSAIGASGSHLGAFRAERDIIAHKPDLVFVEFSVNDTYNGETGETASENYEAIVRAIRKANPECDIVNVYITDSSKAQAGGDFNLKNAHEKVAQAYGIPAVDVGKALITKKFLRGSASSDWKKYFSDSVHMTDEGFAEYAKPIHEFLANELIFANPAEAVPHRLPEKVCENSDRKLQYIIPTANLLENAVGFSFKETGFLSETPHAVYNEHITTSDPDNSLTFTFTGTELSLFMSSYTSGTVTYEIDGRKWRTDRNSMNNPFPIVKNLEYGEHTITMHFGFKDSTTAKIGAFLVR